MNLFAIFWGILIFSSILWYGFLLFYIGYKGGREIGTMVKELSKRNTANDKLPHK